jgi:penicillin-binding protein 1A
METILVKIFATALALSEVLTQPQALKTHFDPVADQAQVVQILRNGCSHMKQAFGIESINLDELISTALDDPKAIGANAKAFHGISFADLNTAYHQFCKNEPIDKPVVDLGQVVDYFNNAAADLPDPSQLKGKQLPSMSVVLDGSGKDFADVFEPANRRIWVPLAIVPDVVQKAFVAAEDQRFYKHHGVDERGIIRAFIGNLANPGRPEGGSTITQQVVKNLLVGQDVTYERKIREMLVASRLEDVLSKNDILQLYLNSAYLGRASWGIEMAARSYFGKSAKDLTVAEGAMLAGLLKGPSFYNPDRHPHRARERLTYVIDRMKDDGYITDQQKDQALARYPKLIPFKRLPRDSGFEFVDYLGHEAKTDGVDNLTAHPYVVHSTINAQLQEQTEAALQEGLAEYEIANGRMHFQGPETNIAPAVQKLASANKGGEPAWQQALLAVHLPLYDVHWTPAVVVDIGGKTGGKKGEMHVGLPDGRIVPLVTYTSRIRRSLSLYDVIYVHLTESKTRPDKSKGGPQTSVRAEVRARPSVQGAALVLQNRTGRILAMTGSFSYPLSQLNRTWQTLRQPGSAIKPVTYLTALEKGLQPNTLVSNDPITLPPIGSDLTRSDVIALGEGEREQDYWSPRNYEDVYGGVYTLRQGLEYSINVVTAHLLDGGIDANPEKSLDDVCATAVAEKIYPNCIRYYPFVLGAQPVHMIDLAAFYAAVANGGVRPQPHAVDSIALDGHTIYQFPAPADSQSVSAADAASFFQLKSILEGVVARGTAHAISSLSPYVAGKTGTTEDSVDGWFIGFTNDVTVAVWVGYDNGDGKRRSLGHVDGARVALPIFKPIIEAIWSDGIAPKAPLSGPSPQAKKLLVEQEIDYRSGELLRGGRDGFAEYFRIGPDGHVADTRYNLISNGEDTARGYEGPHYGDDSDYPGGSDSYDGYGWRTGRSYYPDRGWSPGGVFGPWGDSRRQPPPAPPRGLFSSPWGTPENQRAARPGRDSFWGGRF